MPMDIPVIDLDVFTTGSHNQAAVIQECRKAAEALIVYGAFILHDSRVAEKENENFLDLMEDYFNQPLDVLQKDERTVQGYYVGFKEWARASDTGGSCLKPTPSQPKRQDNDAPQPHLTYKFFRHMNEKASYGADFSAVNVVPSSEIFRERWAGTVDKWGQSMRNAVADLTDMIEIGLDLPPGTFKEAGQYGPHVLIPTSTDLIKYGQKDTVITRAHADVNFLTIHGRSRYPSLDIWLWNTGNWQKIGVEIPPGNNFFVQAGKQLEHLTNGLIGAVWHEVVVNDKTLTAIERRKVEFPDRPLTRVSSTFFWQLSPDYYLVPIPALKDKADILRARNLEAGLDKGDEMIYEPMTVKEQIRRSKGDECP